MNLKESKERFIGSLEGGKKRENNAIILESQK